MVGAQPSGPHRLCRRPQGHERRLQKIRIARDGHLTAMTAHGGAALVGDEASGAGHHGDRRVNIPGFEARLDHQIDGSRRHHGRGQGVAPHAGLARGGPDSGMKGLGSQGEDSRGLHKAP